MTGKSYRYDVWSPVYKEQQNDLLTCMEYYTEHLKHNTTSSVNNALRKPLGGDLTRMPPSGILFNQDSINYKFKSKKTLKETFRQLLNGELPVEDIEPIEVVEDEDDRWWR